MSSGEKKCAKKVTLSRCCHETHTYYQCSDGDEMSQTTKRQPTKRQATKRSLGGDIWGLHHSSSSNNNGRRNGKRNRLAAHSWIGKKTSLELAGVLSFLLVDRQDISSQRFRREGFVARVVSYHHFGVRTTGLASLAPRWGLIRPPVCPETLAKPALRTRLWMRNETFPHCWRLASNNVQCTLCLFHHSWHYAVGKCMS